VDTDELGEYQTVYGTVDGVNFQQGLSDLNTLDPREKTFNHPRRSHGRIGSKSSFSVYEEESPQKHQCHVHRSESVSYKDGFSISVGPEIALVNGWTHGMK
jgi:hypothetical protein